MKATPLDDMALKHLSQGNTATAEEIWSKAANASSLQNRIVLALVKKDYPSALSSAETLYSSHAAAFVESVTGNTSALDVADMIHAFLDELLASGLESVRLLTYITDADWRRYISDKSIQPLVDSITQAIEASKKTKKDGPAARLKAGQKLMTDTKDALQRLRGLIPEGDIRYETIADKLGLEILNCSIDYYNDTQDDDGAYKAQRLLKYAATVVAGQFAKDRCKENASTMDKIIADLPPIEVMVESRAIMNELRLHSKRTATITNAITLLNNTKKVLQTIKKALGANHEFYLKISTTVVNAALGYVIEDVNSSQKNVERFGSFYVDTLKATLKEAWSATLLMDTFDMDPAFKNGRYTENRNTLKSICQQLGVSTFGGTHTTLEGAARQNAATIREVAKENNTSSKNGGLSRGCVVQIIVILIGGFMGIIFGGSHSFWNFLGGMFAGGFFGVWIAPLFKD